MSFHIEVEKTNSDKLIELVRARQMSMTPPVRSRVRLARAALNMLPSPLDHILTSSSHPGGAEEIR
eukprot:1192830-Pyramimonas_sp.AAC.1